MSQQVDLFGWIEPLNCIDSALTWILKEYGKQLLLIAPKNESFTPTLELINTCPDTVTNVVKVLLRFSALLLENSTSKQLYNTVLLREWLAAADDEIADAALELYYKASLPVQLHKQPHPSQDPISNWSERVLPRLVTLTRGYGSAGSGTGLDWALGADDSQALPMDVGRIWYRYYCNDDVEKTIELSVEQMMMAHSTEPKRRKALRSTAELFFLTLSHDIVDPFALLTEIRLARAAHAQQTRAVAVKRRLQAITILLYTHPEVLNSYFTSQPELIMELVRLVKTKKHAIAMQTLSALVARRDGRLSVLALQELGVAKGQYLGVLPTLLRSCLASINQRSPLDAAPIKTDDPALAIGLSYVQAMAVDDVRDHDSSFDEVENILSLASSVASSPTGISALIDCGLLTTLLSVIECEFAPAFVVAQAVQMTESALVTHTQAVTAFKDLNGGQVLVARLVREAFTCSHCNLIYCLLNCLTVYVHHDSAALQRIAEPLKKLLTIQDGNVMALVCNLISEITNNDPNVSSVVKFVHSSGLAASFLNLLDNPSLPKVPELFMSIPNVLFALALTEDGASVVLKANPYPKLISFFYNPEYAMPKSRCLLNEMPSTIGASLEDIMRNVDTLKASVFEALVEGMKQVAKLGKDIRPAAVDDEDAIEKRSCLIQFILNFGQLLEQVLHHDDHVETFIEKGGFEALVGLFEVSIPSPAVFLHYASSFSCPALCSLHHATTEDCLIQTMKCLMFRYESRSFLKRAAEVVSGFLDKWENTFFETQLPSTFVYKKDDSIITEKISVQLATVAHIHWATRLLTVAVQSGGPRNFESGSAWSRSEKEWLSDIASEEFRLLVRRLSEFYQRSLLHVCCARSSVDYEDKERQRMQHHNPRMRYKLRIVCAEGAVVRDGIDIDSCANVGSLEMGEVVIALDRCINSSGILRYRTARGWVSEMTRGHGREPIAEVFDIFESTQDDTDSRTNDTAETHTRIEADVPDIQAVVVGVLSRGQPLLTDLLSSLSKLVLQSTRTLSSSPSIEPGGFTHNISSVLKMVSSCVVRGLNIDDIGSRIEEINLGANVDGGKRSAQGATAMYLSCSLNQLQSYLFEEKREARKNSNFPLLFALSGEDSVTDETQNDSTSSIDLFRAAHCIGEYALAELSREPQLRVPRCVAASFPPLLALLRRLASSTASASPASYILSGMKKEILCTFLDRQDIPELCFGSISTNVKRSGEFLPQRLLGLIQVQVSKVLRKLWSDPRVDFFPPHIMHPLASATGEIVVALEETAKKKGSGKPKGIERMRLSDLVGQRMSNRDRGNNAPEFEPNEDIVARVAEMGFSRDHAIEAIESTRSNDINVVMEYALTTLPPSQAAIQRRQVAHAARERRRIELQSSGGGGELASPSDVDAKTTSNEDVPVPLKDKNQLEDVRNDELEHWFGHLPVVVTQVFARVTCWNTKMGLDTNNSNLKKFRSGDEGVTLVLSSLLFDLCKKRKDLSVSAMTSLIRSLKDKISCGENRESWYVHDEASASVAVLCHSIALMARSLPKSRVLVLKEGLAFRLSSAVETCIDQHTRRFPSWVTPALLLLGILAEPMIIFRGGDEGDEYFEDAPPDSELDVVKADHLRKLHDLKNSALRFLQRTGDASSGTEQSKKLLPFDFSSFPSFFPLLSVAVEQKCVKCCHRILESVAKVEGTSLAPDLCHSLFYLLHGLLRNPTTSADCAKMNFADLIITLPKDSKFEGSTGLVTMVLRRLVEDPYTLRTSMETEIKGAVLKFNAKRNEKTATPSIPLKTLLSTTSPLLCREPVSFYEAFVFSNNLKLEQTGKEYEVKLLSQPAKHDEDRGDATADKGKNQQPVEARRKGDEKNHRAKKVKQRQHGRLPKRPATPKRQKREESAGGGDSPAVRICTALITTILSSTRPESDLSTKEMLLSTGELLEVLADLILAHPSCASAVHTFRVKGKDRGNNSLLSIKIQHALHGCPAPSRSFVNFILHVLLPQDLWSIRNDPDLWGRPKSMVKVDEVMEQKRRRAIATVKLAQASARALLTLVARPGDIRRRVIADLAFALSGGMVSSNTVTNAMVKTSDRPTLRELHSLHAWGELCYAIAAPRSTGKEFEGVSTLNISSIRLMLECGMVHSLLYSIKRVNVHTAMAPSTGGSLLLPLEILTRPAVTDAVESAIRADSGKTHGTGTSELQDSPLPLQDDTMALDGQVSNLVVSGDEVMDADDDQAVGDDHEAMSVESGENTMDESSTTSGSSNHEDSEEEMSEDEDSAADRDAWNADYEESYVVEDDPNVDADERSAGSEPRIEEDWTQIEPQAFSGTMGNEPLFPRGAIGIGRPRTGARGYIDAAEAMISTLMRSGDISQETLAEIEGTLGIRIVDGGRLVGGAHGNGSHDSTQSSFRLRVLGGNNNAESEEATHTTVANPFTMPFIRQRSQPDFFHAAFSRTGQSGDVSPMECVFGGSTLHGNTNYTIAEPSCQAETAEDDSQILTQLGLIPNGSAAVVRMRANSPLHPLLTDIELPPSTSLLPDISPCRTRSRQSSSSRGLSDWPSTETGYFQSGTVGSRRFASSAVPQQRHVSSVVTWPDDAQIPEESSELIMSSIRNVLAPCTNAEDSTSNGSSDPADNCDTNESGAGSSCTPQVAAPTEAQDSTNERMSVVDSVDPDRPFGSTTSEDPANAESNAESTVEGAAELEDPAVRDEATEVDEPSGNHELDCTQQNNTDVEEHDVEPRGSDSSHAGNDDQTVHGIGDGGAEVPDTHLFPNDSNSTAELACPPDFDEDVFRSLPREMQQDCINQYTATQQIAEQLDGSTLDPAVLAELPEDMRQEVIEQDRQQRLLAQQEQTPADPSHAQEMDNASIIASMAPELREDILMTLDESVLNTLPPHVIAEAQILRERASARQRRVYETAAGTDNGQRNGSGTTSNDAGTSESVPDNDVSKKKARSGRIKVDLDRSEPIYLGESTPSPFSVSDLKAILRFLFLLIPLRPNRVLQRLLSNLCENRSLRNSLTEAFISLLHGDGAASCVSIENYSKSYQKSSAWRQNVDKTFSSELTFPPTRLYGAVPNVQDPEPVNLNMSPTFMRHRQGLGSAASIAGHLRQTTDFLQTSTGTPPVVITRILEILVHMCRHPKLCLHLLIHPANASDSTDGSVSCFVKLVDLLKVREYVSSSSKLEQLLSLLELCVYPLTQLSRDEDASSTDENESDYWTIPRIEVSSEQLQVLCLTLRMESCKDTGFSKVNSIVRRLCRVEANRKRVLEELAKVAEGLGSDAYQDLRALRIRMERVVKDHEHELEHAMMIDDEDKHGITKIPSSLVGSISSSVSLSTSTSELKLLRVLQTLQTLCNESLDESGVKKSNEIGTATPELVNLLSQLQLGLLWDELSCCLRVVQVLEGIKKLGDDAQEQEGASNEDTDELVEAADPKHKTLRNSAAGLIARFLPSVEAFFVANACVIKSSLPGDKKLESVDNLVGGKQMLNFVSTNKVLLNALIRTNASLLDKGMRALVQIPQFRPLLDFDVKRNWFKTQVKRLRHQASRRYGSLRLQIRRESIFQDAFFQLQPRNADEMRGRLNVTFRNEEGVDAGGLSREFFGILAKEIFNPNYALFVSTEDGITFQPNPNSMINPDHLSYFRFVGRVVGKAVSDGYLLDAHFTRSLYKHMLGLEPTHHDMEAIDPDYYGNLRTILENSLEDMGLDHLTFSIEDHSFGRNQVIDLVPMGRSTRVTDANKEEYVRLVCQHRMTTSIKSQIKSYLDGFYELVSPELIAIFNPRELELLISGLPNIDVHDLKDNTEYVGWKASDREIIWFWNVIFGLSRNEKASFLQFVTGSSKVPLAGFAELQGMRGTQKFSIHKCGGGSNGALMSAHTCFNSLDLPSYESEEETRQKLLIAINEGGGAFGFA